MHRADCLADVTAVSVRASCAERCETDVLQSFGRRVLKSLESRAWRWDGTVFQESVSEHLFHYVRYLFEQT